MRTRRIVTAVLTAGALALLGLAAPILLRAEDASPVDLVDRALFHVAVRSSYARSGFTVDSDDGEVRVRRRELADRWHEQEQVLRAPYFIVEVDATCPVDDQIASMTVAGLYPTGEACIEEWTFTYPPRSEPLERRPLPTVARTELLRTAAHGRISTLEPDPAGRFVLFVTCDDPAVYRLARGARSAERIASLDASGPARLFARRHASEGLQFHLLENPDGCMHPEPDERVVVLRDPTGAGDSLEAETLSMTDWNERGYTLPGPWIELCPGEAAERSTAR